MLKSVGGIPAAEIATVLIVRRNGSVVTLTDLSQLNLKRVRQTREETTQAKVEQPPKDVRPRFPKEKIEIPLSQCETLVDYKTTEGLTAIAIWKSGKYQRKTWYRCLFINKETETAYHNEGGFYGKKAKMRNFIPVNAPVETAQEEPPATLPFEAPTTTALVPA